MRSAHLLHAFGALAWLLVGCSSQPAPRATTGAGPQGQGAYDNTAMEPPVVLERVQPDRSGLEHVRVRGVAIVEVHLSTEGYPETVRVVKSLHPDVDARVVDAVRMWRFEPATLDGKPKAVFFIVTVNIDWR